MFVLLFTLFHAHAHPSTDCPEHHSPPPRTSSVAVLLHDAPSHETVSLRCPGGFSEQVTVETGIALFPKTPTEDCLLSLHDETTHTVVRAVPGARLLCATLPDGTRCVDVNQALQSTQVGSLATGG